MLAALHSYLTLFICDMENITSKVSFASHASFLNIFYSFVGVDVNIFAVLIPMGIFWTIAIVLGFKCIQRMRKGNIVYCIG